VRIRREEALKAFELLGVKDYEFLDFEDSKVVQQSKDVEERLKKLLESYKPDLVFAPSPFDSHPDHSEIGKIIKKLFPNAYFYLIWGDKKEGEEVKFEVKDKREKKVEALNQYKSQIVGIKKNPNFEKFIGDYEIFYKL